MKDTDMSVKSFLFISEKEKYSLYIRQPTILWFPWAAWNGKLFL